MDWKEIQSLLAKSGYYKGGIDGDPGRKTRAAIEVIERTQHAQYPDDTNGWGTVRRGVAAAQAILNAFKFEAGEVDGISGHNTEEAFRAWIYKAMNGKREQVSRAPVKTPLISNTSDKIPHQRNVRSFYGTPGKNSGTIRHQLTTIKLPFRLRIDWNLSQTTNKITVHKKCAPSLLAALIAVEKHYGLARMQALGIDRYAGAYNPRKMRGGSSWSMHAYGCAIDFYARPNGLRVKCPKALFCGAEYKPFLDIMESHGWLPAVRLWGKDAMHFQRARL